MFLNLSCKFPDYVMDVCNSECEYLSTKHNVDAEAGKTGPLILIFCLEVKGYQWADWTKAPSVLSPGNLDAFQAFG